MDYDSIADFTDEILRRKDPYDHHGSKVAILCMKMAALMDTPPSENQLALLHTGARLHDVGKIFIEDAILNSHGLLTTNQRAAIQTHTTQGFHIALSLKWDPLICMIIRSHHENMDGSGYPDRIPGKDIPFFARMIRVADTYDAMTSKRAYRNPAKEDEVMQLLEAESGRCFDPYIVQLLKKALHR